MEDLNRFPRPNVAVDVAVLTVIPSEDPRHEPGSLAVLVQERLSDPPGLALPGRFLREGETVLDCVATALREKAGMEAGRVNPRLLRVFDAPDRDPRGWTISLAHCLVMPHAQASEAEGTLLAVDLNGGVTAGSPLLFDHAEIVREAAARIREAYELEPDPGGLLTGPFTLADLRAVHEAVLGEPLQRDTFRRRMEPGLLPNFDASEKQTSRVDGGRPAREWIVARDGSSAVIGRERMRLSRA